jgi:hypothetical protein
MEKRSTPIGPKACSTPREIVDRHRSKDDDRRHDDREARREAWRSAQSNKDEHEGQRVAGDVPGPPAAPQTAPDAPPPAPVIPATPSPSDESMELDEPTASPSRVAPPAPRSKMDEYDASLGAAAARGQAEAQHKTPLRKGKWTQEEELFAEAIIREFRRGMLALPRGTTLRSYLAKKLHCDPMRISKKFAGAASIGVCVFAPCKKTPELQEEALRVRAELLELERRFAAQLKRLSTTGSDMKDEATKQRPEPTEFLLDFHPCTSCGRKPPQVEFNRFLNGRRFARCRPCSQQLALYPSAQKRDEAVHVATEDGSQTTTYLSKMHRAELKRARSYYASLEAKFGNPHRALFCGMIPDKVREVQELENEYLELQPKVEELEDELAKKNREYQDLLEQHRAADAEARDVATASEDLTELWDSFP